jgi:bacterioferritin-associated ferredoxin
MYVCICKGVTESQICEAIERGLCTRKEIASCLKAGTGCGKCGPDIRDLLQRTETLAASEGIAVRADLRERKHPETRRHVAAGGRVRRILHPAASLGEKTAREPASSTVGS